MTRATGVKAWLAPDSRLGQGAGLPGWGLGIWCGDGGSPVPIMRSVLSEQL